MKAVVLCAGKGTRLGRLTEACPKPMLPIGGRPLLEHTIAWLRRHDVTKIAINLHHRPRVITDHLGDGSSRGVSITYLWEDELLGSAGTVRRLAWFCDEPFVVVYGDVLFAFDLAAMREAHMRRQALVTVALQHCDEPTAAGIVALDAEDRIVRFLEKPKPRAVFSTLANAGLYVMDPALPAELPDVAPYDFGRDVFPALLAQGRPVYGHRIAGYARDIGTPTRYLAAQSDWSLGRVPAPRDEAERAAELACSCGAGSATPRAPLAGLITEHPISNEVERRC